MQTADAEEVQRYPSIPEMPSSNVDYQQKKSLVVEQEDGSPQSGCDSCEPADRCCSCFPIKCGMLMVAVGSWLGYLNFFQAYNNIRFYNMMIDN